MPAPAVASATPAALNPRRPAIIVPVLATAPEEIARQCVDIADTAAVDVIEWRIDAMIARDSGGDGSEDSDAADPQTLAEEVLAVIGHVTSVGLPVLITLRTGFEGGAADVSEDDYAAILTAVITGLSEVPVQLSEASLALDVEIERTGAAGLIDLAHQHHMSVVASHHNFAGTDSAESMLAAFTAMAAACADVIKIAMMPQAHADVADVLRATAQAEAVFETPVIGISMGQLGRTSRVMGGDFGSCASFAQLGVSSAPGQIAVADLAGIFDRLYG